MKKKIAGYLALLTILSIAFYYINLQYLPNMIYEVVHLRSVYQSDRADNVIYYPDLPDEKSRSVVMPNPDFLYVASFYDISKGDLEITGTMPDSTYWSIAFYEPNTVNYYVKNDMEYESTAIKLRLTKKDRTNESQDIEIVESPKNKGFMLFRILVTDDDPKNVAKFKAFQKTVKFRKL